EGDLGDKDESGAAAGEDLGDEAEVDLGLARARDAAEEVDGEAALEDGGDARDGALLRGRERGERGGPVEHGEDARAVPGQRERGGGDDLVALDGGEQARAEEAVDGGERRRGDRVGQVAGLDREDIRGEGGDG